MRCLAFGDLHLGHGAALGRAPGDRLNDQAAVLDRILEVAVERNVDVILNAGDTFEGPAAAITPEQQDIFSLFVVAARDAGIPIVAISGNARHDAAARATNGVAIYRHIPGITISSRPQLVDVAGMTIATLPWVHPGRYIAQQNGDAERADVDEAVAELLTAAARGLRAEAPQDRPAVLLLHWSVSGAVTPTGMAVGPEFGPVLDLHALEGLGFDAIVCGHIHKPQPLGTLAPDDELMPIFYVGSPLPLNFGETSVPHGVWILDNAGGYMQTEFVPIESRRLVTIDVDVADTVEGDVGLAHNAIVDAIEAHDVNGAIVRLRYRATADQARRIDPPILSAIVREDGAHSVKLAPEIVRADRARVDTVTEDVAPLDAYDAWTGANDVDPDVAARAREQLTEDLETVTT